jgi:hypothetical protein
MGLFGDQRSKAISNHKIDWIALLFLCAGVRSYQMSVRRRPNICCFLLPLLRF